ncbi:MAG: hypothetical protein H6736_10605 [Alphaproteobacteria bacterium]|nr:hypothetical protein [Alphaproteobacteria bacterium]
MVERILFPGVVLLALTACFGSSAPEPEIQGGRPASPMMPMEADGYAEEVARPDMAPSAAPMHAEAAKMARSRPRAAAKAEAADEAMAEPAMDADDEGGGGGPAAVRSWFPDAFLWEPVVVTSDDGVATVDVRVPDSLTDWRVLGLAHDRTGQQAGALTGFATRIPVAADPRLPSFLFVGDELALPVRATNGTDDTLAITVDVEASGGLSGGGTASVRLGPRGTGVPTVGVRATERGRAVVRIAAQGGGHLDRSERTLRVTPTGRPLETVAQGVLQAETTVAPPVLEGTSGTDTLEIVVFPGPLALVSAELDRLASGARTAIPGGALSVIDHLLTLSERTGAQVDEPRLRRMKLLAWQQIAQRRTTGWLEDVALLRGMSTRDLVGGAEATRPQRVRRIVDAQKDDGTWSSASRSTLQRVLVETAMAAMVLPGSERGPRLKAEGAVERQIPLIEDAYTAAVLLGSGVLHGEAAQPARTRLREAIGHDADGVPSITVPDGVVDAWGDRPSHAEMLAWTVLALADDPEATEDRGKLATALMASWSRSRGFGAGRADPVAMLAVVDAIPGASAATKVTLVKGGQVVSVGTVDPAQPGVPLLLETTGADATVRLDPPVDGLAYTATRRGWVPWEEPAPIPGFEWTWTDADPLVVGQPAAVGVQLAAPRGIAVTMELGIPAGMTVDAGALASQPLVAWSEVLEDRVRFRTRPMPGTGGGTVELQVTPGFAGRFGSVPVQLDVAGQARVLPGRVWTVKGA